MSNKSSSLDRIFRSMSLGWSARWGRWLSFLLHLNSLFHGLRPGTVMIIKYTTCFRNGRDESWFVHGLPACLAHSDQAVITSSVAINGSSSEIRLAMTRGYTTNPSLMFCSVVKILSAVKNASGRVTRWFSLRYNKPIWRMKRPPSANIPICAYHCPAAVTSAFWWSAIKCRARLPTRWLCIGFRLYAMAEFPIWSFSKRSSISWRGKSKKSFNRRTLTLRWTNNRMSLAILWAMAKLASRAGTSTSTLCKYVCEENGHPESSVTRWSRATSWSTTSECLNLIYVCLYFKAISVEQGKERRLHSRRTIHTTETKVVPSMRHIKQVPQQLLHDHTSSTWKVRTN